MRYSLGVDVFKMATKRMRELYAAGHTVVVSFSAGKDSGACLEVALRAAEEEGRGPVNVVMRDEEIMFPGTFEFAERTYKRQGVKMRWVIANQPIVNAFNRTSPYWWVFDPTLPKAEWVREPPEFAERIPGKNINSMVSKEVYPVEEGKDLIAVIGLRANESMNRRMAIASSKGFLTQKNEHGVRYARPIYDWTTGDVWKAHKDNAWDYNQAYDTMYRLGVGINAMRIAPPTLTAGGIDLLKFAIRAWPTWFDKVDKRCPGIRTAAMFGRRAIEPIRRMGEDWETCFKRECIETAPAWIAERATNVMGHAIRTHAAHSSDPLPQAGACKRCWAVNSWRTIAKNIYMGDPFSLKFSFLSYIEPEFFRPGAGTWGAGKPAFG